MLDSEFHNLLSAQTRYSFYEIWQGVKAGEELQGEEKVIGELMQNHPQYHDTWDHADELADKKYDPEKDVNPFMHIVIDSIVVNQINQRTPPEVGEAYNHLRSKGMSHLDALHEIDRVFIKELWPVLKYQKPFNAKRYVKRLKRLR